jgi:hypothetical protein
VGYGTGEGNGAGVAEGEVEYVGMLAGGAGVADPEGTTTSVELAAGAVEVGAAEELGAAHRDGVLLILLTIHDEASSVYSSK